MSARLPHSSRAASDGPIPLYFVQALECLIADPVPFE
jgi:hypothetical protein